MEKVLTQAEFKKVLIAAHNMAIEAAIVVIEREQISQAKRILQKVRKLKK